MKLFYFSLPAVLLASTACWLLALELHAPLLVRVPITLWFMAVCPGLAVVRHVRGLDVTQTWTLAVALSLALALLVSTVLVYVRPLSFPVALSAITLLGTLFPARTSASQHRFAPDAHR